MRRKTLRKTIVTFLGIIIVLQIALLVSYNQQETNKTPEDVARIATPAVVSITADEKAGSGVMVREDGFVLTNAHILGNATKIHVIFSDNVIKKAKIIGIDEKVDLAVLKVNATGLPAIKFGDSEELKVGEEVIAIGHPYGYDYTVTTGIVSAKHRDQGPTEYRDFIQTDASINPGNSGGPLLNLDAELIGINTFIVSDLFSGELGFSIPSNLAYKVMEELIESGHITRGYMGISGSDYLVLDDDGEGHIEEGALVALILEDGPADKAGIKPGDLITEINGIKIESINHLRNLIAWVKPGQEAKIKLIRNETEIETTITTIENPN